MPSSTKTVDMRYKIELAYNGSNYAGWQIQPNAPTVQEAIDRALSTIANTSIETMGCGRTDAGVHAKFFVAHFDGPDGLPSETGGCPLLLPARFGSKLPDHQSESFRPWTSGQPGRLFWKMPGGITVCLLNN